MNEEERLVQVESSVHKNACDIDDLKVRVQANHDQLQDLMVAIAELNSTLQTAKWIIMLMVSLFGGIIVFLFKGIIQSL